MKTWIVSSLDEKTIQGEEINQGRKLYEEIRYILCPIFLDIPTYPKIGHPLWTFPYRLFLMRSTYHFFYDENDNMSISQKYTCTVCDQAGFKVNEIRRKFLYFIFFDYSNSFCIFYSRKCVHMYMKRIPMADR